MGPMRPINGPQNRLVPERQQVASNLGDALQHHLAAAAAILDWTGTVRAASGRAHLKIAADWTVHLVGLADAQRGHLPKGSSSRSSGDLRVTQALVAKGTRPDGLASRVASALPLHQVSERDVAPAASEVETKRCQHRRGAFHTATPEQPQARAVFAAVGCPNASNT